LFGPSKTDQSQSQQLATLQKQINELNAAYSNLSKLCNQWFLYSSICKHFNSLEQLKHSSGIGSSFRRFAKYPKR
jgi:hypothetical protein